MKAELSYWTEKIREGDRSAFDELFRRCYPMMISYARLFLKDEWAKDVVQDVFLSVWHNRKKLDPSKSISRYLLKSVFNRCCNYMKIRNRTRGLADTPAMAIDEMGSTFYNPDKNTVIQNLYSTDIRDRLNEALDQLSPKCREVFSLSYIDDLSNKEIAERLGISVRTVESHLFTAVKKLRLKLSPDKLIVLLGIFFLK